MPSSSGATPAAGDRSVAAALKDVEVERIVGPASKDFVTLGSLWEEQPVVLHLLRRFGCRLCRGGALDMSQAVPHLMKAGVRVVAIGPEPLGVDEFVKGKYWAGELYVDDGRRAYRALHLKSLSYYQMFQQLLFNADVKRSLESTKSVAGNFAGDGMQLGGTYVLKEGGELLAAYEQDTPADHPSPEELLSLFNLDPKVLHETPSSQEQGGSKGGSAQGSCPDDQCS